MDSDLLGIADTCACSVLMELSKIKLSSADFGGFAARTFRKNEVTGSYYKLLVYRRLSSKMRTKKVYGKEDPTVWPGSRSKCCRMKRRADGLSGLPSGLKTRITVSTRTLAGRKSLADCRNLGE